MTSKKNKKQSKKRESRKRLASLFSGMKIHEIWIALGVLLLVVAVAGGVFLSSLPGENEEIVVDTGQEGTVVRHPLTGRLLEEALDEMPRVFGVMVENAADAWPLAGLDEAFLVIEAPVEAGIPRFIAFFSEGSEVEKIGPVRSARPYYLDWNDALGALYAHVGGSPEALELIRDEYDTLDLNQFWWSQYFWRDNGTRYAPHNVYTSTELLLEAANAFDLDSPEYTTWVYGEIEEVEGVVEKISIDFADGSLYDPEWTYDWQKQAYERNQAGYQWLEGGAKVYADNIIVLATDVRTIDNIGRKALTTVGSGKALVFRRGHVDLVDWVKEDRTERVRWEKDGEPFPLAPGTTWIEVVDDLSRADY